MQFLQTCFLADFAKRALFDGFSRFLLSFGKIPYITSEYYEIFSLTVSYQSSSRIDFLENIL